MPRDLLRSVLSLAVARSTRDIERLPQLAQQLISDDVAAVLGAQLRHAAMQEATQVPGVIEWLARAAETPVSCNSGRRWCSMNQDQDAPVQP